MSVDRLAAACEVTGAGGAGDGAFGSGCWLAEAEAGAVAGAVAVEAEEDDVAAGAPVALVTTGAAVIFEGTAAVRGAAVDALLDLGAASPSISCSAASTSNESLRGNTRNKHMQSHRRIRPRPRGQPRSRTTCWEDDYPCCRKNSTQNVPWP